MKKAVYLFAAKYFNMYVRNITLALIIEQMNTFQAVLITDGQKAFVMFNYLSLMWSSARPCGSFGTGLGGTPALVSMHTNYLYPSLEYLISLCIAIALHHNFV